MAYPQGNGEHSKPSRSLDVERTAVRKYFLGQRTLPIVLIIVGLFLTFIVIGFVLIIVGVVMLLTGDYSGEDQVDEAMQIEIDRLSQRGISKLNVINEQINMIEPITLYGPGSSPDSTLGLTERDMAPRRGILSFLSLFKSNSTADPIEAYKIGSDDVLRHMLLQVTVYAFGEDQLLVYTGNVDISTGKIYNEHTVEIFYQDIAAITTSESLFKLFNKKKKKFFYKFRNYVTVQGNGFSYTASLNSNQDKSYIDRQFAGMRSLIREKKNSLTR